jgi:hypothetical protein
MSDFTHSRCSAQITRAVEQFEFEGAFRCLYRSYHRRGLAACTNERGVRLTRHHLLPETRVLIARTGRNVVGTLTLAEDSQLGLPLRAVFDAEVNRLAAEDPRLAEATCLAIDDPRRAGIAVMHGLMGLAAQAASRRGITRLLIAVHPRHAPFYVREAGFREFAPIKPHPYVQDSPAIGLQLNLATLRTDAPRIWKRYYGMNYSPLAVSTSATSCRMLQRLERLWNLTHGRAQSEIADVDAA